MSSLRSGVEDQCAHTVVLRERQTKICVKNIVKH